MMWSGGTIIIFAIVFAYLIFEKFLSAKIFNMRNYLIINGALVFGIVVMKVQNLFSFIIVDILGKDITLTGRIYIWDKVIGYIAENPIFGYGVETYTERLVKMYMGHSSWQNNYAALHSHCRYLETLYRGGIILFGIYLSILILATKKLMQFKNTIFSKIMSISIFAYLTGMMTEWYDYCPMLWVFLVMAFHASSFCAQETHLLKKEEMNNAIY